MRSISATTTITIAPSAASGRSLNSGVKKCDEPG